MTRQERTEFIRKASFILVNMPVIELMKAGFTSDDLILINSITRGAEKEGKSSQFQGG